MVNREKSRCDVYFESDDHLQNWNATATEIYTCPPEMGGTTYKYTDSFADAGVSPEILSVRVGGIVSC